MSPTDRLLATRHPRLLLVLLCLVLWLPGFWTLPTLDRDEGRFVQATKQMIETGDFVNIRNGEAERNKKPIGIHWAQAPFAAAAQALGVATQNPVWPYRIPGLLGGIAAVLATWGFGRRLVGDRPALLGAMLLASCIVLTIEVRIAKTDAALLGATTVAMGLLARAYLDPGGFSRHAAMGFWLAVGVGVLLKGPITPMIAGLTAAALAVADRRGRGWRWMLALRPRWGAPLALAVVLPWFIAIGIATEGRFFAQAIGDDLGGKIGQSDERHWGPPGLYVLLLAATLFPAAWFAARALPQAWAQRALPETRFLLAWIVPSWLVFEVVATKLPHYVMPMYPALCLLGAAWVLDPRRRPGPRWWAALAAMGFGAVVLALGTGALILPVLADSTWRLGGVLALLGALAFGAAVLQAARRGAWPRAALLAALGMPLLTIPVLHLVLPRIEAPWISDRLTAAVGVRAPDDRSFGIAGYHEPSLLFLAGTGTVLLRDGPTAADWLAAAPGRLAGVGERDIPAFMAQAARIGLTPIEQGTVTGFNYNRGRRQAVVLFRRG
jgi:hypothetical protein